MNLINDWQRLWHRLWSIRLSLLSALAGTVQSVWDYIATGQPRWFVIAATLSSFGAAVVRLVAQPKLHQDD